MLLYRTNGILHDENYLHHLAIAVAMATSLAACQQKPVAGTDTDLPAGVQLISDQSQTNKNPPLPFLIKHKFANGLICTGA